MTLSVSGKPSEPGLAALLACHRVCSAGIEDAFRRFVDGLARRGVIADVHVFGGAAMATGEMKSRCCPPRAVQAWAARDHEGRVIGSATAALGDN